MINLYQFPGSWDLPSTSPYCLKLETCFRIFKVPFRSVYVKDFSKAPKGKVPYVKYKGQMIGDSGLIISRLQEDGLIPSDVATRDLAFLRLIEEHLAPAMVYSRWIDEANFAVLKEAFFGQLPPVLRQLVPKLVRRKVAASLRGHGIGLHSAAEIGAMSADDLEALALRLGEFSFFAGQHPGLLDAAAYGILANILVPQFPSALRDALLHHPNLLAFCDTMKSRFYAENQAAAA